MNEITLMSVSTSSRLNRLRGLISGRRANAKATAEYLDACGRQLPEKRLKELQMHLDDTLSSIREMDAEYTRLAGSPCDNEQTFNIN